MAVFMWCQDRIAHRTTGDNFVHAGNGRGTGLYAAHAHHRLLDEQNAAIHGNVSGRRRFLVQLTGLAAATALEPAPAGATEPESAPLAPPLPTMQLGTHRISRVVAGSNPILGYSYLGPHTDRHLKEYFTVERTVEFLQSCERAGITAHQFADPERALPYVRRLRELGSKLEFICLHAQRDKLGEAVALTQPMAMVHHGGVTDRLFAEGKAGLVHDYVKAAHDAGVLAGVSAHNPDCIKRIADEGLGGGLLHGLLLLPHAQDTTKDDAASQTLEIAYPFYRDDPKVMTGVMRAGQTAVSRLQDSGRRSPLRGSANRTDGLSVRIQEHQADRWRHRRHVPLVL